MLVVIALGPSAIVVAICVKGIVRVDQGHALVVGKLGTTSVHFGRAFVVPYLHRAEVVDLRVKTIRVDRRGKDALSCRDGIRVDLVADFQVRVDPTAEGVLAVANTFGAARTSDAAAIEELFHGKFASVLAATAKHYEFEQLDEERGKFRQEVIEEIGTDLGGFVLDDLSIVTLEQAPIEQYDPDNILDARGLQKVRELTLDRKMRAAERESQCRELLIRLERIEAEAMQSYTDATGLALHKEDVEKRLEERLRAIVVEEMDA